MTGWDDLSAFALTLPETGTGAHCDKSAVEIAANDRAFVSSGEAASLVLTIGPNIKKMLLATSSETFWQTPHYDGRRPCSHAMPARTWNGCGRR